MVKICEELEAASHGSAGAAASKTNKKGGLSVGDMVCNDIDKKIRKQFGEGE
jgi:hypothetical protein